MGERFRKLNQRCPEGSSPRKGVCRGTGGKPGGGRRNSRRGLGKAELPKKRKGGRGQKRWGGGRPRGGGGRKRIFLGSHATYEKFVFCEKGERKVQNFGGIMGKKHNKDKIQRERAAQKGG